jgi:hypothetical protein
MFEPNFREGRPEMVLVVGPPPLLRAEVDAFVDLFEGAFSVALLRDREQALRDAIETDYAKASESERRAFASLVAPRAALKERARKGEPGAVPEGLTSFRLVLDATLPTASEARWPRLVEEELARCRETAWPGSPPVPVPAADTWLELVEFVVSVGRNADFEPTLGQRTALRRTLAAGLHGADPAVRTRLAGIHKTWLGLKSKWDRSGVDDRLALRWKLVGLLARALPPELRIAVGDAGDLGAYARTATALSRTQSAFDAWANLARNPAIVLTEIDAWLGPVDAAKDHTLLYR